MATKEQISKGLLNTAVNAYEPSHSTLSNPYNTQATRDVGAGKSGIVGNAKAGDKVYNPKTTLRSKLAQKLKKKFKELKRG
jgi:hypothetical protein